MKIRVSQIPLQGSIFQESLSPAKLDVETEIVKFKGQIDARARVTKITNAVTVDLSLAGDMKLLCGRCLEVFDMPLEIETQLNYPVGKDQQEIDIGPDIREEIMLDYPIQPLCKPDCRGICPKCGKNLNEGGCSCATTKEKTL